MIQLPQIITDMRAAGIYDAVAMPDGSLHPGDERALLAGCWYDVEAAERVIEYFATLLVIPWEKGDTLNDWERYWINRCAPRSIATDGNRSSLSFCCNGGTKKS